MKNKQNSWHVMATPPRNLFFYIHCEVHGGSWDGEEAMIILK